MVGKMSKNPLAWKFLLILGVVAAAFFFSYPPQDRISLGLDFVDLATPFELGDELLNILIGHDVIRD